MINRDLKKAFCVVVFVVLSLLAKIALADDSENFKVADGVEIYLGILPAEVSLGHPKAHTESEMHGGTPTGENNIHLIVALFDKATGKRITDANVTAFIKQSNLEGKSRHLESMTIANTITYGNYFVIGSAGTYRIILQIRRPNKPGVINAEFIHEHVLGN